MLSTNPTGGLNPHSQATQTTQPSCFHQSSSGALWLRKNLFTLIYYSFALICLTAPFYLLGTVPGAKAASGSYYSGEDLKGIWQRTESLLKAGSYDYNGKKVSIDKPDQTTRQNAVLYSSTAFENLGHNTSFQVVNQDAVYTAMDLKKQVDKVALLNPANAYRPGGGTRRGAAAMEEDLCRRSALLPELEKQSYPLKGSTLLYTADVPFFRYGRDRQYAFMEKPVALSVITSAALDLNPEHNPVKNYRDNPTAFKEKTWKRAYAQLWKAAEEGNKAVVLAAFGCGAFQNDPEVVARIYRDVLETKFKGVFENVTFAVLDDHNAKKPHNPHGNYFPFYEVFVEGKE
ncbi:MAG: hypothetical protein KR126chlam3_00898 [Chlamydiae bacterium]|nr:hypothetical protein [Chlamydiota bacterium]